MDYTINMFTGLKILQFYAKKVIHYLQDLEIYNFVKNSAIPIRIVSKLVTVTDPAKRLQKIDFSVKFR